MHRFWNSLVKPCLEAAKVKNIVEIGCDLGHNTTNLIQYCQEHQGFLDIIDPAPRIDVEETYGQYKEYYHFHKALSLNVIWKLKDYDAILIDGDHNWYTVYHELKMIQNNMEPFPLVLFHDISWPYDRRDLYYDLSTIPAQYVNAYAQKGIDIDTNELVENGFNSRFFNSVNYNNQRCGVLTAVEDFLAENEGIYEYIGVPLFNGLGVMYAKGRNYPEEFFHYIDGLHLSNGIKRIMKATDIRYAKLETSFLKLREDNRQLTKKLEKSSRENIEKYEETEQKLVEAEKHTGRLEQELNQTLKKYEETQQKLLSGEKQVKDLQVQVKTFRDEADRHLNSVRYQAGTALFEATHSLKKLILLPITLFRLYKLYKKKLYLELPPLSQTKSSSEISTQKNEVKKTSSEHLARKKTLYVLTGDSQRLAPSFYIRIELPIVQNPFLRQRFSIRKIRGMTELDITAAEDKPAVLVSRNRFSQQDFEIIEQWKKDNKILLIYEIDDDLLHMDPSHKEYAKYMCQAERIERILKLADKITVTSSQLKKQIGFDNKTVVIPNYIDASLWSGESQQECDNASANNIRILYQGSLTHDADISLLKSVISKLNRRLELHGKTAQLIVVGGVTEKEDWFTNITVPSTETLYPNYVAWLNKQQKCDIAVAPLALNEFNKCKSNLKYLEYSMMGLPCVFSDSEPYHNSVKDGETGYLIPDNEEGLWVEKLYELCVNDEQRKQIAENAMNDVRRYHLIENHYLDWAEVFLANSKSKIAIKIPVPRMAVAHAWGDYHLAISLKKELEKIGYETKIQILPEWEEDEDFDVVIVLRGIVKYTPKKQHFNIMWNISHPDDISVDEYNSYDYVLIASDIWAEKLKKKLSVPIEVMHQCTDLDVFYPDKGRRQINGLLFVGNSRKVFRKILKDIIPTKYDLSVYGGQWEGIIDQSYIKGTYIPNESLREYYSSCDILLNDHWDDMREKGFLSNRLYDGFASGAFIISDEIEGAKEVFGDNLVTYSNKEELQLLVEYYMEHPEERREKAEKARQIVLERHTVEKRAEQVNKLISAHREGVSIIMPCYNRKGIISRAIDSVLRQSYTNYQLIIIDDGSSDGTKEEITHKYKEYIEEGRIVYIRSDKNIGVCAARNLGLEQAKGNWIAYLDSDNEWRGNYLEEMVKALKATNADTIYCAIEVQDKVHNNYFVRATEYDRKRLLQGNFIDMNIFMHHRRCYETLGGFSTDLKRLVDWDLILRYTQKEAPIFLNKDLAIYYQEIGMKHISVCESLEENRKLVHAHFSEERKLYGLQN